VPKRAGVGSCGVSYWRSSNVAPHAQPHHAVAAVLHRGGAVVDRLAAEVQRVVDRAARTVRLRTPVRRPCEEVVHRLSTQRVLEKAGRLFDLGHDDADVVEPADVRLAAYGRRR
jgi:hypothetical protein